MKIIIVGCGKVGKTLAEQLSAEDNDITVIDMVADKVKAISNEIDVIGVVGSSTNHSVLREADIANADLLIAVTGSDELNLLCCVIAQTASKCQTIARVRNPEIHREIAAIKEALGLSMVINPELISAEEIARVLRFPSAIDIETFAKGRVEILKFRLPEDSVLCNLTLREMTAKGYGEVLVCMVERDNEIMIPNGNSILRAKDIVSIVANPRSVNRFFKKIKVESNQVRDTMIIGGGKLSYYLAQILLDMGIEVKIIEKDKARCDFLCERLPKATIIYGDGVDQNLLMEEGLDYTESFVTLTNIDEENILLSLTVKDKTKAKVVTKVSSITFDDVINKLDLDSVVYPRYETAERIIRYVRAMGNSIGSNVETLHHLAGRQAEALEFIIKEQAAVIDISLAELSLKENILIGCINRGGNIIIPKGQDKMMLGDTVVVVTTIRGLGDISDILKE